jgi:hypothetical protein
MSFEIQYMLGNKAKVSGTDSAGITGATVVDTTEWEQLKQQLDTDTAIAAADEKIKQFLAPLVEAVDEIKAAKAGPTPDSLEYVVTKPGVDAVAGQEEELTQLSLDSIILRAIEEGQEARLMWVDESTLGVVRA